MTISKAQQIGPERRGLVATQEVNYIPWRFYNVCTVIYYAQRSEYLSL